jgi:hypothetical protein
MPIQDPLEQTETSLLKAETMLEKLSFPSAYKQQGVYGLPGGEPHPNRRFNVGRLLKLFPLLRLEKGCKIDYIYHNDGYSGEPRLYTQKNNAMVPSFEKTSDSKPLGFLPHFSFQLSPLGYLQFVLFSEISTQFYLYWHANYRKFNFVLSRSRALAIIKGLEPDEQCASMARWYSDIDFTPELEMYSDGTARVLAVIFTMWGGFERRAWYLRAPDAISAADIGMVLIPYDCGIVF